MGFSFVVCILAASVASVSQDGRACQMCRKVNQPDATFCGGCGTKIAIPKPAPTTRVCADCKKPNQPDAKFCGGCGKKLAAAPAPPAVKGTPAPILPRDKAIQWVEGRNKDALNVAPPRFGTRLRVEPPVEDPRHVGYLTDRNLSTYVRVKTSVVSLDLAAPVEIDAVALYYNASPDLGRVRLEGALGGGPFRTLSGSGGGEVPQEGLCLFEFKATTVDRLRLSVEDLGQTWLYEVLVYEVSTRADRSRSVVARKGMNIAALASDGCVMHTTGIIDRAALLIDEQPATGTRMEPEKGAGISLTFAFAANREVRVRGIELVPTLQDGAPLLEPLPSHVRVSVSVADPFDAFRPVGSYARTPGGPLRFDFPSHLRARFLRVELDPSPGQKFVTLGELRILEGTGEGYESLVFSKSSYITLRREGPAGVTLVPEGHASVAEKEPNDKAAAAMAIETGAWIRGNLGTAADRDYYRFITLPDEGDIAVLDLRMNPFLRTTARVLDLAGKEITRLDLQRTGGSTGEFPVSVPAGAYVLELTACPVYLLLVCDTSGSMSGTFGTTSRAIREWAGKIPPGFHLAMANSTGPLDFKIVTPFTTEPAVLQEGLKTMFQSGSSSWYSMIHQGLKYTGGNVPRDAVAAAVLLADGNGSGQFRKMWEWLRESRCRLYTIGYGGVGREMDVVTSWNGRRGLFNTAWYRGGRYYEPRSNTELVKTYGDIFDDLATPPQYAFRIRTRRREPGILETEPVKGDIRPIHFILDASGSMMANLGEKTRLRVAKEVIARIVETLPPETPVGLRVYGHRYRTLDRARASTDSQLVVPIGRLNPPAFMAKLARLKAVGGTPLAYSLLQAHNDLGQLKRPRLIVITDGVEGFRGKPVRAARLLAAARPGMDVAVVGFAIGRVADQRNLEGMATAARGVYTDAENAETLIRAVEQAVRPRVPYVLLDTVGTEVGRGHFGDRRILPEGSYTCVLPEAAGERRIRFDVRRGRTTRLPAPSRN